MTDDQLIELMQDRLVGGGSVEREFGEFYGRHKDYLAWAVRRNPAARVYGVDSLAHDTLIHFFERMDRYQFDKDLGEDQSRHNVRAYLGTIARRLAAKHAKQTSLVDLLDSGVQLVPPESQSASDQSELARLRLCLKTLQSRDRTILLVSVLYWDARSGEPRIPPEQLDELRQRVHLSKEALRARRRRALSKLRACMEGAVE